MDKFETLEAVSVAIYGFRSQLALMAKVFFWIAGGGALALGYLVLATNSLSVAVAKIESKLEAHDQRFDAIDKRFDAIDKGFDAIDKRFDVIDERFESIDKRLDEIVGLLMQPQKKQGQLGRARGPLEKFRRPVPTAFQE